MDAVQFLENIVHSDSYTRYMRLHTRRKQFSTAKT
jgi:hypothetical protein